MKGFSECVKKGGKEKSRAQTELGSKGCGGGLLKELDGHRFVGVAVDGVARKDGVDDAAERREERARDVDVQVGVRVALLPLQAEHNTLRLRRQDVRFATVHRGQRRRRGHVPL